MNYTLDTSVAAIHELDARYVMGTYRRQPPLFLRGEGCRLFDSEGKSYLDFLAGIAVCSVGHCHPRLVRAVAEQAAALMHLSNLYLTSPQARLAERLCKIAGFDKVFFANTGTEGIEAALKIARKRSIAAKGADAYEVISLEGSFHGRTLGSLSLTAQPKYQAPFGPMPPGAKYIPASPDALSMVTDRTAAVFVEPIQGESGVHPISDEFLQTARAACDRVGALLVCDEIQCGLGRTGRWFGFERAKIRPDIIVLAKGLGGGVPVSAVLARGDAANVLVPGDHGSTFAANPVAMTAALTVLHIMEDERLLANAAAVGSHLAAGLRRLPIDEVRGEGLMLGVGLRESNAKDIVARCCDAGLILNATDDHTLRILPPLTLSRAEADEGLEKLAAVMAVNP